MKRTLALVLALLMLMAIAVGCADSGDTTPDDTTPASSGNQGDATPGGDGGDSGNQGGGDSAETTPAEVVPEFAEADYNKDEFLVFQRNANASSYPGFYIDSEEVTDTMSEAVFVRNLAVEEKYNVVINTLEVGDPYKEIRTYISSGDIPFDVVLDRRSYMGSLAQEGYFYNFNDLEHVDFSQPYWDSNCAEDYEVAGKLFFMVNDVSVSNLAGARFFYFNKNLISEYNLQDPYKLVEKNEWTLDNFLTLVSSVAVDDGDGVWTGSDIYGLLSETGSSNGNIMHLLVGCDIRLTEKNPSGLLETNAYTDKTQIIMSKVATVLLESNSCLTYAEAKEGADTAGFANNFDFGRSLFANDHFLFVQGNMKVSEQFRDMTSDYGVVPNPKYDAAQDSYYHKMDKYSLIWAIPKCTMDYDRVGIIMEYWAYESSKTVMPAYYEITIKTKRVQEETASQMIDIVKDSILYDLSEIYSTDVVDALYNGYVSGNLSSTWAASKRVVTRKLDKIYDDISNLE